MNQKMNEAEQQYVAPSECDSVYTLVRKNEKRIYTDSELLLLPQISATHIHAKEWKFRAASCKRLLQYLEEKRRPLQILEIGCGNGWLSHRLSALNDVFVTGTDINLPELRQAIRVFGKIAALSFVYGGIEAAEIKYQQFDIILFAASIQYFSPFAETIHRVFRYLKQEGEVHILDSHFYSPEDLTLASQRTYNYYTAIGYPEMADEYFHHGMDELKCFNYSVMYSPSRWKNYWHRPQNPFKWFRLKKEGIA